MADGGHDRIDELKHLQRSIEMQYLVLDTAVRSRCFEELYKISFPACILSLLIWGAICNMHTFVDKSNFVETEVQNVTFGEW